jgi:hypothetical protein
MRTTRKCKQCKQTKTGSTWYKGPKCYRCHRKNNVRWHFTDARLQTRKRGFTWNLSFEYYSSVVGNNCYYCNGILDTWGSKLDRKDNSKGYVKGNVVACCYGCNKFKSDILTPKETKLLIAILKKHRPGNLWPLTILDTAKKFYQATLIVLKSLKNINFTLL